MNLNKLRALILKKEFSAKDLIVSKGERAVIDLALVKPINSMALRLELDVSASQACQMLNKLEHKGYLQHKVIHVEGNNPYKAYSVPLALRKLL